ncbi:MAG TPA: hypothetical protein DCE56_26490 [Cyanobacteria bacterium UBA8553]|nr:hypothetical protein [Cyanobacteria bacterium UBA8553]
MTKPPWLLVASCWLKNTNNPSASSGQAKQPTTNNQQLTTNNKQQTTNNSSNFPWLLFLIRSNFSSYV